MTKVTETDTVVRNAGAATAQLDGQLVALDVERGVCYGLNGVATQIWTAIETPTSAADICITLCTLYAVDRETCVAQTCDLLDSLIEAGLAQRSDGA